MMSDRAPTRDDFRLALSECALVRSIYHFEEIGSTSDFAKDLIGRSAGAGSLHGTIIIANHQTSGRGRFERRWDAPAGRALLFSLIVNAGALREDGASGDFLKTATAVAVCEAIAEATGLAASIKFPNDILIKDKKVAGVLLESTRLGGNEFVIIGVGVNVNQGTRELPGDTRVPATSMAICTGREFDIPALLVRITAEMQRWYCTEEKAAAGRRMGYLCDTVGKFVEVETADRTCHGLVVGVSDEGALIIRTEAGTEQVIYSGDIKQLAAAR